MNHKNTMSELEWMKTFGDNLRDAIEEYGYTQDELAEITGLSRSTISNYIHHRRMPSIKAIINLSYALDEDLYDFIDFGNWID